MSESDENTVKPARKAGREPIKISEAATRALVENIKTIDAQLASLELSLFQAIRNGFLSRYPQVKGQLTEFSKILAEIAQKGNEG